MKSNRSAWVTALVSVIVGLILIIYHSRNNIFNTVVEAIGILVAVVGLGMTAYQFMQKKENRNVWYAVLGVATLAIGLWLCFDARFFVNFVAYVLGAAVLMMGIWHMFTIKAFGKVYRMPAWLWIIPSVMIVSGIAVFFTGVRVGISSLVLATGIILVLGAFNTLAISVRRPKPTSTPSEINHK